MTVSQAIARVDEGKPNAFSNHTKTVWLNEIEGMVQTEIFLLNTVDVFQYD